MAVGEAGLQKSPQLLAQQELNKRSQKATRANDLTGPSMASLRIPHSSRAWGLVTSTSHPASERSCGNASNQDSTALGLAMGKLRQAPRFVWGRLGSSCHDPMAADGAPLAPENHGTQLFQHWGLGMPNTFNCARG